MKVYGRHTALLPIRQLADADLVCFELKAISEVDPIETMLEA
jgi:hypothetical protein